MRRGLAWLLLLAMLTLTAGAYAEGTYRMAGYDGDGSNHDWLNNLFFQRMEEQTGVSFSFDQHTDFASWTQRKADYLSGAADMPDVLFKAELTPTETMELLEAGRIIDLKPYLAENAPNLTALLTAHPEWEKAITLPGGQIAALPSLDVLQSTNAMWINRTWLDNLGLAVPTTAEELTDVLRAFQTGDPNQNGKRDEVPLTFIGLWDLKFLGHAFGLVANDYGVTTGADGVVSSVLPTEENRAFLTWLHGLWEERLIDRQGFRHADAMRAITDSKADIPYGVLLGPTPLSLVPSSALNQYELLMPLTYGGKQIYRDLCGDVVRGTFAISADCENPAELLRWVDKLYTEEGCRLAQAGLEGVEYAWNEDGRWYWEGDAETVASTVLAEATIMEGGRTPGYVSPDFQLAYDEKEPHRLIEAMQALKEKAVVPYPLTYMTREEQAKLDALQLDLGRYAEQTMVWFVTGDLPLNDETWTEFMKTLADKGLDDMVSLLQSAIH